MPKAKKIVKKNTVQSKPKETADKQLVWILIIMGLVLISFFILPFFFNYGSQFTYDNLTFVKTLSGKLPVFEYSYNFKDNSGQAYLYHLFLRNDPRQNNVSVYGGISYPSNNNTIFLSINTTDLLKCNETTLGVASLSAFFANNLYSVVGAFPDKSLANEDNVTFADCNTYPNNMVVVMQNSSKSEIIETNPDCYTIYISNCNVLDAAEKFEVQSIVDAKIRESSY